MDTTTKITSGAIGTLSIIAIIMSAGLLGHTGYFVCQDNQLVIKCDSLSSVNSDGLQTRCYFFSEDLNRSTYKQCSTGWLEYVPEKETDKINFSEKKEIYLYCYQTANKLINECQILDENKTLYKLD